jgi:branched-chain amino acid transport system ATP-binding protein
MHIVSERTDPFLLELSGLRGGWGETTVVDGVSLQLRTGETVALVGRNGVGKSTLLELVVGRARRHQGTIRLAGQDISEAPIRNRTLGGLGYVPQEREVFASLTVRENLQVAARPGAWNEERLLALFAPLARRIGSLGGQLSGGEQQMLSIARALIGNPRVLLMDEPSEGLAPLIVEHLVHAVRTIVRDGSLAVLLVEQRLDIALDISARCLVMDQGRIVHEGPSAALREDSSLLASVMGFSAAAPL